MTQEITQDQKQIALAAIEIQLDVARAALKEAEKIAIANEVDFSFSIGYGDGEFETYRNKTTGVVTGDWYGWQGSNC
jgi:hypothetical protein